MSIYAKGRHHLYSFGELWTNNVSRPNHSPRRIRNKILAFLSRLVKSPRVFGYPTNLMVEPNNYCNLKCPLCPIGRGTMTRPAKDMDYSLYCRLLSETGDYLYDILFDGMTEPLLCRDIYDFIAKGREQNIRMSLYTNFQNRDSDMPRNIVESGLDYILISLDGASKVTYERYRAGGDYEVVTGNIRKLAEERKRRNATGPFIDVQFIVMRGNEAEIGKARQLRESLGADRITFKYLFLGYTDVSAEEALRWLPARVENSNYILKNGTIAWKSGRAAPDSCRLLWTSSMINSDGSVSPCCFDYNARHRMGRLDGENTFADIWNGRPYRDFRKEVSRGRKKCSLCASVLGGCPEGVIDDYYFNPAIEP